MEKCIKASRLQVDRRNETQFDELAALDPARKSGEKALGERYSLDLDAFAVDKGGGKTRGCGSFDRDLVEAGGGDLWANVIGEGGFFAGYDFEGVDLADDPGGQGFGEVDGQPVETRGLFRIDGN